MAIERLTLKDAVTSAFYFACNNNGQDYRVAIDSIVTYAMANITTVDDKITQYAAPSATAFSVQVTDGSDSVWLVLTPTAGFVNGTIVLPALANCADKQEVLVNCTQAVTTLVVSGNGATVTGAPTTLAANAFFRLRFDDVANVWYRVG